MDGTMVLAHSMHEKEEKCIHRLLVSEIWMKEAWNSKHRWEESIKMETGKKGRSTACSGLMWISTGTNGRLWTPCRKSEFDSGRVFLEWCLKEVSGTQSVSENNVASFTKVKKKIHTHKILKYIYIYMRFEDPWRSVLRLVFWDVMPFCFCREAHHFVGTLPSPSSQWQSKNYT